MAYTAVGPAQVMIGINGARYGVGVESIAGSGDAPPASTTFSQNVSRYYPLYVDRSLVAQKLWWLNGATVNGNVDIGIYNSSSFVPGAKIITTGSTAQAGTNVIQEVDITDTFLKGPALYFIGLATDSATATFFAGALAASVGRAAGVMQQLASFPLPSTATPVVNTSTNYYYCGIAARILAA